MRPNSYTILCDCLDAGIAYGLRRADKHADDPLTDAQRERLAEHLEREILNAICEKFDFDVDRDVALR
jgi:hypothetical protein